jgi:hypothetical protein
VGIANDFSFDDAMAALPYGCTVDSMDPSMGRPDHKHAKFVNFHNFGLAANDMDNMRGVKMGTRTVQRWKVHSLRTVMQVLNAPSVDVLKVDVEGSELDVLESLVSSKSSALAGVRQLLIEIHLWPDRSPPGNRDRAAFTNRWLRVFARLHDDLGFRTFSLHTNPMSSGTDWGAGNHHCCYEIGFFRPDGSAERTH